MVQNDGTKPWIWVGRCDIELDDTGKEDSLKEGREICQSLFSINVLLKCPSGGGHERSPKNPSETCSLTIPSLTPLRTTRPYLLVVTRKPVPRVKRNFVSR